MEQLNLIMPRELFNTGVAVYYFYLRQHPTAQLDKGISIPFNGRDFVVTKNKDSHTVEVRV